MFGDSLTVTMASRKLFVFAVVLTFGGSWAASIDVDSSDYEVFAEEENPIKDTGSKSTEDVRCYCNQPECVSQGYMCRGQGCFTELPKNSKPTMLKPEHSAYSGCLETKFRDGVCPMGFLCCKKDMCNHIDDPAMRNRLNKTLKVLNGDQTAFLNTPSSPTGQSVHPNDGWFKTTTIVVLVGGLIVLLILASLAIRLLQPVSSQNNKLTPHRTAESAPPLLGSPKVPLV